MSSPYYPYYPEGVVNAPQQHDSHVILYDASVIVAYRIAAKERDDIGMTYAIKVGINSYYLTLRELRVKLLSSYPHYLKDSPLCPMLIS